MNEVLRVEKKYLINIRDFLEYSHAFDQVLMQDAHNGIHGYRIRSLYFDTMEDNDFYEKDEGIELRRKIRLRLYDPRSDFAVLEMKQKQGQQQLKRSLRMNREDALCLTQGVYSPLLKYPEEFAKECYGLMNMRGYRPKSVVEYNRKAFIAKENKIRITFDNCIAATEASFDLFSKTLNLYPVLDPFLVVLEVKYNGFLLSYIRDVLNRADRSELSVSKYCLGRSAGLHYAF